MLPYYEYVNHMLHAYFARDADSALSEADIRNCAACDRVLRRMDEKQLEILREVISQVERTGMAQAVQNCASHQQIARKDVWRIVRGATKEIARERGLV